MSMYIWLIALTLTLQAVNKQYFLFKIKQLDDHRVDEQALV